MTSVPLDRVEFQLDLILHAVKLIEAGNLNLTVCHFVHLSFQGTNATIACKYLLPC